MKQITHRHSLVFLFVCFAFIIQINSVPTLPQGIHVVSSGAFQTNMTTQQVMVYYDFNRDQSTDIITKSTLINGTKQTNFLNLYLWNDRLQYFVLQTNFDLSFLNVKSILATSFYDETIIDILLTYQMQTVVEQQTQIYYQVQFVKLVCNLTCTFSQSINVPQLTDIDLFYPSLITINNGIGLLFGKNSQLKVLTFFQGLTNYSVTSFINFPTINTTGLTDTSLQFGDTYYGDYTGDCIADFIISQDKNTLYFFEGDLLGNLHFTQTQLINNVGLTLQHFSFADINFDGKMDQVLLFREGVIQIHYHKYSTYQLCSEGYNKVVQFPYDFNNSTGDYIAQIQRFKLQFPTTQNANLLFSDFNNDGYQDFIVDIINLANQTHSVLFINQQCYQANFCGDSSYNVQLLETVTTSNLRTFTQQILPNNLNPTNKMSFLDIYKDGKVDLLAHEIKTTILSPAVNISQQVITTYFNNQHFDAFFMKITVLHGDSSIVDQNINVIGANVDLYITQLGGNFAPKIGNQLSQTGRALQLPYIFFGLGRTNNYVEDLTITIPISPVVSKSWSPIIPNSQLIILGPQNGVWALTTFINPTSKMAFVIWLVILSLGGIGFVICWLTKKEKEQDKEQLQNFYAILG